MNNEEIWKHYGLTKLGAKKADRIMPAMLEAVRAVGPAVAWAVLKEAIFQVAELPNRDRGTQANLRWQPPKEDQTRQPTAVEGPMRDETVEMVTGGLPIMYEVVRYAIRDGRLSELVLAFNNRHALFRVSGGHWVCVGDVNEVRR